MRHEPTAEEAQTIIDEYPVADGFVQEHFQMKLTQDGPDDNSMDLLDYWGECYRLVYNIDPPPFL